MDQATSVQIKKQEILKEERAKVAQRLDRLNDMLDECDGETAAGLKNLRTATREQLNELDQQLDRLQQT